MTKPPDYRIYLASKSPRRRELLRQIGIEFELLPLRDQGPRGPDVPETSLVEEAPAAYVMRIAMEKAMLARQMLQLRRLTVRPVLTADTSVVIDNQILGKPSDMKQAMTMLHTLSGRTHEVFTSIVVMYDDQSWQLTQRSEVTFGNLSQETIRAYCATQEPYDKAGGYGIQGRAGMFIEHITGSYSGIMGLPLFETAQLLKEAGIKLL